MKFLPWIILSAICYRGVFDKIKWQVVELFILDIISSTVYIWCDLQILDSRRIVLFICIYVFKKIIEYLKQVFQKKLYKALLLKTATMLLHFCHLIKKILQN